MSDCLPVSKNSPSVQRRTLIHPRNLQIQWRRFSRAAVHRHATFFLAQKPGRYSCISCSQIGYGIVYYGVC